MKLQLKIEEQQKCAIHRSLIATLEQVAQLGDLDAVEKALRDGVNPQWWMVGRGGHHVFLSLKTAYQPVRVAIITEAR